MARLSIGAELAQARTSILSMNKPKVLIIVGDATGPPAAKFANLAFQLKMVFMALAGVNVAVFYLTGVADRAHETGAGEDAPAAAKVIAFLSIFCWIAVIYFGRMIMYADAFYTPQYYSFGPLE